MRENLTRRNCLTAFSILILLLVLLVVGGSIVISRFVNIGPILSDGGEAEITVPDGFSINIFASGLQGPRFMAVGPDGHLYVADRINNRIIVLPDRDNAGVAYGNIVFAPGLNLPLRPVCHDGDWYVVLPGRVA